MSWKSLITAGCVCVLASPAFAQPKLEITSAGLNASGQFVWNVRIAPNLATDTLATELGFKQTVGNGVNSVTNTSAGNFDYNNPGNAIFTWEKTYSAPLKPEGLEGNFTGAVAGTNVVNGASSGGNAQTACLGSAANCTGSGAGTNEIFSALGSKTGMTLSSPAAGPTLLGNTNTHLANSTPYLQIVTNGPSTTGSLTSTIQLSGAYTGGSGRIAGDNGVTTSNYKGFTGTASITVKPGDINLDGTVGLPDLTILAGGYNSPSGKNWTNGDFTGDGAVNLSDLTILAGNYNTAGGSYTPLSATGALDSPGSGSSLSTDGGAVPEPASIALIGLALLGSLGVVRRKR